MQTFIKDFGIEFSIILLFFGLIIFLVVITKTQDIDRENFSPLKKAFIIGILLVIVGMVFGESAFRMISK